MIREDGMVRARREDGDVEQEVWKLLKRPRPG
jgi:hypothetical protein